jgi:hypothetical protein
VFLIHHLTLQRMAIRQTKITTCLKMTPLLRKLNVLLKWSYSPSATTTKDNINRALNKMVSPLAAQVKAPANLFPGYHPPPQPQSYPAPSPHPPQATYQAFYQSTAATPHHTQSESTSALYDKARQAAAAKNNPGQKARPGLPSQRRPWSTEEENALMAGLDTVKGPHWSQILALYGSKGTVSEVLKDRNQVQLKDKARNLKLFFLKSNIEVPYYLQCVTGELKTRAPSQAARKEAEERARLSGDEEAARFHGVMALASGMQSQSQSHLAQTMNASGNVTPYHRTPTPVSTSHHSPHSSPERLHVVEPVQAQEQEQGREGQNGQESHQQQQGDVRLEEMNTEDRLMRALSGV